MKPCETPMCDGTTVRARWCRRCYDRFWAQTPQRKAWVACYEQREDRLEARRQRNKDYRDAGKVPPGSCVYCDAPTSSTRNWRCLPCYQAKVLPLARAKGLRKIHQERD